MKVIYREFITRAYVRAYPTYLFLFGDNLTGFGLGGQAKEMRGEPNAIGVPTKMYPGTKEEDYFTDVQHLHKISDYYDSLFAGIEQLITVGFDKIVIPQNGLGTGLSKMQEKCPKLLAYLNEKLKELEQL